MVESQSDEILKDADTQDVAFLVVGDPFSATTHTDLALRCRQHEPPVPTRSVPNASILTAVGVTGLSLYNFGQTVSMVFFTESWKPSSFYDRIVENASLGFHTLMLLDIKVKEPDLQALARGKIVYEKPRFMTVAQCAAQMLEVEEERQLGVCAKEALAIGVARLGSEDQQIVAGTLMQLCSVELGPPLHSLLLCGKKMHEMEWEYVREFAVEQKDFDEIWKKDYAEKR